MIEIERILRTIETILQKVKPTQFSDSGCGRLEFKIKQYVSELIKESVKIARAHRADSVSASYVNRASEYLSSGRALRKQRLLEIIGNVALGVGVTVMIPMILTNQYSSRGVILGGVLILFGVIIVVLQVKDF